MTLKARRDSMLFYPPFFFVHPSYIFHALKTKLEHHPRNNISICVWVCNKSMSLKKNMTYAKLI